VSHHHTVHGDSRITFRQGCESTSREICLVKILRLLCTIDRRQNTTSSRIAGVAIAISLAFGKFAFPGPMWNSPEKEAARFGCKTRAKVKRSNMNPKVPLPDEEQV
jgi:hypothetical protein